jgi:hypothetical protein
MREFRSKFANPYWRRSGSEFLVLGPVEAKIKMVGDTARQEQTTNE